MSLVLRDLRQALSQWASWILRGSTAITFLASSAPRWRMVEPTAILTAYRGSIDYDEDQMEDMPQ